MSQRSDPKRSHTVRLVFGVLVGLAGLLNLFSVLVPPLRRLRTVERLIPLVEPDLANLALVLVGLLLLVLARQLARGKRRAWTSALILLGASAVLHLVKGPWIGEGLSSAVLAVALGLSRRHFSAARDAPSFSRLLRVAPLLVAAPFLYGIAGVYLRERRVVGQFTFTDAALDVASRMVGLGGRLEYTGVFGRWFPVSITALSALSGVVLLYMLFRPVVEGVEPRSEDDEALARELVSRDDDTLAYFALRDDKRLFFSEDRKAAVAYRAVGGIALVSGDPLGSEDVWPDLLQNFVRYAHERGWPVAALAAGPETLAAWQRVGCRTMYMGDEAVIDPRAFTLEGRVMRKVRQSASHVERGGYTAEWHRAAELNPDLRRALLNVSETWKAGDEERGFSMSLGRLFDARDPDCLVAVARDGDGTAKGFMHFVPVGMIGYSLDVIRRDPDTPSGMNEFLIARTLLHLGEQGVQLVSLNFAFLREILTADEELGVARRVERWVALKLGPWFQIESLYRFNDQFGPDWRPRHVAYEGRLSLPGVLLASARAERLIDLKILTRGQGGKRSRG